MMLRFLSVRRKGRGTPRSILQIPKLFLPSKNLLQCKVLLLDASDISVDLSIRAVGSDLYKWVFYSLDLLEKHYFGLQYTDADNVEHWLDPTKGVKKQVKIGPPYILFLKVKFYSSEPSMLREELTRYQFFLQLKQDIAEGRLPCPFEKAVELSALALQSELGDFDGKRHNLAVISEFKFIPDQTEEFEIAILEEHQRCKGLKPAQAEMNYLNKAMCLPSYAIQNHVVLGNDDNEYYLGLMPIGVKLLEGSEQIGVFRWPNILRLDFKKKKITLIAVDDNGDEEHTFVFRLPNEKACKRLWKCAVEYHAFYRLYAPVKSPSSRQKLFRMGSGFRYCGKTEFEHTQQDRPRRTAQFERRPSQRYARRQSHTLRLPQKNRGGDASAAAGSSVATVTDIGAMIAIESAAATGTGNEEIADINTKTDSNIETDTRTDIDVEAITVTDIERKTDVVNDTTTAIETDVDTTTSSYSEAGTALGVQRRIQAVQRQPSLRSLGTCPAIFKATAPSSPSTGSYRSASNAFQLQPGRRQVPDAPTTPTLPSLVIEVPRAMLISTAE